MFTALLNDKIKLIKQDGTEIDNIVASVQTNKIFTEYTKTPIDEGDILSRKLPNGKIEYYEVINPIFHNSMMGIDAHYQIEVRKTTLPQKQSPVYIRASGNAKVNINSMDNSINNSFNKDLGIFDQLLNITRQIQNNKEIVKAIAEMKNSVNDKKAFKEKYNNFIQSAAAHMTLFAPFISELTRYF